MCKKFDLVDEIMEYEGRILSRLRALKDFKTIDGKEVKCGDLGGFVESEANLSQEGRCWIVDKAIVCGNSQVCNNAIVCGRAEICDSSQIRDNAVVSGSAFIGGNAEVFDKAKVMDRAEVFSNARIFGQAEIGKNACVCGSAQVMDHARVEMNSHVYGNAIVCGRAEIGVHCKSEDLSFVICGDACVCGRCSIETSILIDSGVWDVFHILLAGIIDPFWNTKRECYLFVPMRSIENFEDFIIKNGCNKVEKENIVSVYKQMKASLQKIS